MSGAGVSLPRSLGTFIKRNKNKFRDYMTTGPVSRDPEIPRSRDRGAGIPARDQYSSFYIEETKIKVHATA